MNKIKIAIAGYGKIGKVRAKVLETMEDIEIVGIYDINESAVHNEDLKFYKSFDELLDLKPDAIFICALQQCVGRIYSEGFEQRYSCFL